MFNFKKFQKVFKNAFLPNGYPHSVSNDYLQYQCWDSAQAFASSILNNLAAQAVFRGVGVGDANATVLAATMTWILKDGTSIIGSLLFATLQCTRMDSDCKRWRLFADLANDIAILIDLTSPLWTKNFFIWIQCCSGILRSLVGIAGGATRAALTQHQAKYNNMADVSAKDQSQERIVNLLALIFSLLIIPLVSEKPKFIWIMFLIFVIGHIYSNYRAIRSVEIEIFNAKRLALFLQAYFSNNLENLSIKSVNQKENVWFFLSNNHDQIFDQIRFIKNKPNFEASLKDPNGRFEIYIKDNQELKIFIPELSSLLIIEALCLIFIYKNDTSNENIWLIHQKNFAKILELIQQNNWNVSHVLVAELFEQYDDEDDFDHSNFEKKFN